jgi:hypothetical protein
MVLGYIIVAARSIFLQVRRPPLYPFESLQPNVVYPYPVPQESKKKKTMSI